MMGMLPSFFIGPTTCATFGENGLPSMVPVTDGAGWNGAAGALSAAGAEEEAGAAAAAGAADEADEGAVSPVASLDDPDFVSSDDVSADGASAGGGVDPPQAASPSTPRTMTAAARMRGSFLNRSDPRGRASVPQEGRRVRFRRERSPCRSGRLARGTRTPAGPLRTGTPGR